MHQPLSQYFVVKIPVKPYIKKYLQALYGRPVVFSTTNYFGATIIAFLDRKFYSTRKEDIVFKRFDKLTDAIDIYLPKYWLNKRGISYGYDVSMQNTIIINKMFEERFAEDICKHCTLYDTMGFDIKDAIEDFCTVHMVDIETDISFDALKKKEYRYRKEKQKQFHTNLSCQKSLPLPEFNFLAIL